MSPEIPAGARRDPGALVVASCDPAPSEPPPSPAQKRRPGARLGRSRHPAVVALVLVVAAEWWLPSYFDARLPREESRNARVLRDWDRYVASTSVPRKGELRVLLLSNSQGRGPEIMADRIYPSLLAARLTAGNGGRPVRVVNWSFASNRVPEAIVLLARAQNLNPHLVLAVFPPNWFRAEDLQSPLSRLESDITETAWFYRRRLPRRFRERYLSPTAAIRATFARYWPSYRYRDLPVFALFIRARWSRRLFPEAIQGPWFDLEQGRIARERLASPPRLGMHAPSPELVAMFMEAGSALAARKVFVLQPLWFPVHPRYETTVAALQERLEGGGWINWNMTGAVPWNEYFAGSVHLTQAGHARFADALAPRLASLLPAVARP